ncbi:hypothetical protein [Amycolatopsis sp. WAC 04182]|nr:hypothetical protein [Amycolatopsis sp. WAC 04182]
MLEASADPTIGLQAIDFLVKLRPSSTEDNVKKLVITKSAAYSEKETTP